MSRSVEVVDRKLPRQPVGPPPSPGAPAPAAAATLAFTVSAAILAALSALLQIAVGHNEATEWTLFLAAFAVLRPGSLAAVPRLTRDWSRPPRSERLLLLALLAALALTLALLGTRLLEGPLEDAISTPALLLVALAACFGAALLIAGPLRASPARLVRRLDPELAAWLPAGVLVVAGLVFAASRLGPALPLVASLAIAAALLVAQRRLPPAERFGPRASLALDIAALLLVFLIVDDIAVYTSPSQLAPDPGLGGGTVPGWLAVHYDPFIG